MNAEALEDPAIRARATFIRLADYRLMLEAGILSENTELIDGAVVDKMTKSPEHNFFSNALYELLRVLLPEGSLLMSEKTLTADNSDVEPDLMVVAGPLSRYRNENPATAELVIEIARTTLAFDRAKSRVYAAAGVPLYWIVDLDRRIVEVYSHPEQGAYTRKSDSPFSEPLPVFGKNLRLGEI